jgi:hypothetical protein
MDSPVDVIAFTDTAKAIAKRCCEAQIARWGRETRSHFGQDRDNEPKVPQRSRTFLRTNVGWVEH